MGLPNIVKYLPTVPAQDKTGLPNVVKYLPNAPAQEKTGSPNSSLVVHCLLSEVHRVTTSIKLCG
jgi:hypothetical protein